MKHNWENYFDVNSEYWKETEKIYEKSEHFPKKVVKERNLHHKFPRSFSKKEGIDIDNDEDNLVSLSLSDHFRVHYYLWKCSKKGYRGMMALAFNFMRNKMVKYASDETIEQLAKDYENAVKDAAEVISKVHKGKPGPNKGKRLSDEQKKKLSEAAKGKPTWNKGKTLSEKHRKRMSEASKGKPKSEIHKKKIGEANKRRKNNVHWFNNGKINKLCKECPDGFIPGRLLNK